MDLDDTLRAEQWNPDAPVLAVRMVALLRAADPERRGALAGLLTTAARHLGSTGRDAEALPYAEEAVALYRELGDEPGLATALDTLALRLSRVGLSAEAHPAIEEAVAVRRKLTATNPGAHRAALARSLFALADADPSQPAYPEALTLLREAAAPDPGGVASALMALDILLRGPVDGDPDRLPPHLLLGELAVGPIEDAQRRAGFVRNLRLVSLSLAEAGADEAAEVGFGVVLAEGRPLLADPAYAEDVVFSVAQIARTRDRAATVPLWEDTIAGLRATDSHAALADALCRLAQTLNGLSRYAEALPAAQESAVLSEHRAPADLALSLSVQATALAHLDRAGEAVAVSDRCVAVARREFDTDPGLLGSALADASATLARAGRPREALDAAKEALKLYQALNFRTRGEYRQDVMLSLRDVAARYAEQGKRFRARVYAAQANTLEQP